MSTLSSSCNDDCFDSFDGADGILVGVDFFRVCRKAR